ncbi:DUF2264 domain-containing protein [Microbacterium amylolyticum]|uniref:DUF2264 domain-containing protein n=1 Tax=Microbacterium amylolyticum TaxID=936337 RepID=A0ABS4ZGG5_9MICO|nr:DUF2264 domain-containing protein [Microbacterium amylolyticum]MBP2436372.1 hypothetical protein [Microbacterium amylolyticum]
MQHDTTPTGTWSRDRWTAFADRLLEGAMAYASEGCGRITPPGEAGGYGRDVDGLEGFARSFLIAGFRIAGERGQGVDTLIDHFSRGIVSGVDPEAPDRWVRMDEHAQAKVEAASIALILDMTRPWIWDKLDSLTQERVVAYLAPVVGDDTYPRTNWLWFRVVVETFLRSVGGPWSQRDIDADLALHDDLVREDGWITDGEGRSYDHYVGWALHLYPVLWSRMRGARDLVGDRTRADIAALDRYLVDALHLVGADGSPLFQGRSLIYRFAAAAPFWAGVIAEVPSTGAGALRHAAERITRHFDTSGAPDERDLLTIGWHHEWRQLAQSYSGPGSPYWAAKGLLGIALPADHPVWQAAHAPLPAEERDSVRAISAPGWAVSVTAADGIVRIANHGTDHAEEGSLGGDSPLYARLGYSTVTSPLLDDDAWRNPLDQSVTLIGPGGEVTHRSGMTRLQVSADDETAVAASSWDAHVIAPDEKQQRHGSGLAGQANVIARVTAVSVLRGAWELRFVRVDDAPADDAAWRMRWGGWALSGDEPTASADGNVARAENDRHISLLRAVDMPAEPAIVTRTDATPLGPVTAIPTLTTEVAPGQWMTAQLTLAGRETTGARGAATADLTGTTNGGTRAHITWPDGHTTQTLLPLHASAPGA